MSDGYLESLMSTGEQIQRVAHQHWLRMVRAAVISLVALAVVAALGAGLASSGDAFGSARPILWIVLGVFALAALGDVVLELARWRAKQYVVTTRRVIEVDGLVSKTVTDSNLDKVNDVIFRQSALGRVLNYGEIEIITGSDIGLNRFEWIADPVGFKRVMLDNKEDLDTLARPRAGGEPEALGPDDVPAAITRLGELRDKGLITPDEFERKKAELLARF